MVLFVKVQHQGQGHTIEGENTTILDHYLAIHQRLDQQAGFA